MGFAVVYSSDVFIIDGKDVDKFTSNGFEFGGYASTEEEANILANSFCK